MDLKEMAAIVNDEHKLFCAQQRNALDHAYKCGHALIEVKAEVGHGHYLEWLKNYTHIKPRTASDYIWLAEREQEIRAISARRADLVLMTKAGAKRLLESKEMAADTKRPSSTSTSLLEEAAPLEVPPGQQINRRKAIPKEADPARVKVVALIHDVATVEGQDGVDALCDELLDQCDPFRHWHTRKLHDALGSISVSAEDEDTREAAQEMMFELWQDEGHGDLNRPR
jgi:hypothetical protein